MMSKQEIFDRVSVHLLTQGEKAVDVDAGCQYRVVRNSKVLKCAIGALIPDEKYSPSLEGNVVSQCIRVQEAAGVEGQDLFFIDGLQRIHDQEYPAEWRRQLVQFAHIWGLSTEKMNQAAGS